MRVNVNMQDNSKRDGASNPFQLPSGYPSNYLPLNPSNPYLGLQAVPVPSYQMVPVYINPALQQLPRVAEGYEGQGSSVTLGLPHERVTSVSHIGVFWDIENCSVPRGKSALFVVQKIRERFFWPNYVEAEFVTACDIRKESANVIQELNDAQVTVIHVSGTSKNAADDKLRQAMRRYADAYSTVGRSEVKGYGTPAILLISGDVNFASDLSDLRHRKRLHVILLHNPHAPEALLLCAHEHYDFHSGLGAVPQRSQTNAPPANHWPNVQPPEKVPKFPNSQTVSAAHAALSNNTQHASHRNMQHMFHGPPPSSVLFNLTNPYQLIKADAIPTQTTPLQNAQHSPGGLDLSTYDQAPPGKFYDIVVWGFPAIKNKMKIEQRLKRLSDNCGGKVMQIAGQKATIRFKTQMAALRAAKRIHGEVVCGAYVQAIPVQNKVPEQRCSAIADLPSRQEALIGASASAQDSRLLGANSAVIEGSGWNMWTSPELIEELQIKLPQSTLKTTAKPSPRKLKSPRKFKIKEEPRDEAEQRSSDSGVSSSSKSDRTETECTESIPTETELTETEILHLIKIAESILPKLELEPGTETTVKVESANENGSVSSETEVRKSKSSESESGKSESSETEIILPKPTETNFEVPKSTETETEISKSSQSVFEVVESRKSETEVSKSNEIGTELLGDVNLNNIFSFPDELFETNLPKLGIFCILVDFEEFSVRAKQILTNFGGSCKFEEFLKKYEFLYGFTEAGIDGVPLEHLLSSIKRVTLKFDFENGAKILKLSNEEAQFAPEKAHLKVEIVNLLKSFPRCILPLSEILGAYESQYGKKLEVIDPLNPEEGSLPSAQRSLFDYLDTHLRSSVHCMGKVPDLLVTLTHEVQMKRFAVDVLRILKAHHSTLLPLEEFGAAYASVTGRDFVAPSYGMCSLRDLTKELTQSTCHISIVQNKGEIMFELA